MGEFKDGKRHGRGFEGTPRGEIKAGYWLNDEYVGKGKPKELKEK